MLKKDEAIKGCAAWLSTTRGVSVELLDGESHGETNVQAAGARVRLGRAAAAKVASLWSIIFSSTMCRQRLVRGLQWRHSCYFLNFSSFLVSFRGRATAVSDRNTRYNIYIRVGICIVLKAVRRIQLYYSWRWRGGPGGHDDGGGGRRRGGDTLWCNTCSGAESHATSKTPPPPGWCYAPAARPRPGFMYIVST